MARYDLSQPIKALRAALLADASLVALLGAADGIYRGWPNTDPAFPCIVINVTTLAELRPATYVGVWEADLDLMLYGANPHDLQAIDGYLETTWTIPRVRRLSIDSTDFRITKLRRVRGNDAGILRRVVTDEPIHQFASQWLARITLKTAA